MEDVVNEIDKLAYKLSTSRSNLINRILAEYISYETPEKRVKTIFDEMERHIRREEAFQILSQPSEAMLIVRSALRYRYKPTVRYSVEIYNSGQEVGALRVSFRTQSQALLTALDGFFQLWRKLENACLKDAYPDGVSMRIEMGRATRIFRSPQERTLSDELIAMTLAAYILMTDAQLKCYFSLLDQPRAAAQQMERRFTQYLHSGVAIL